MSTDVSKTLADLRQEIDDIDQQLLQLLSKRAFCAQEVAEAKVRQNNNKKGDLQFYRPEREAQVLKLVMEQNQGPLPDEKVGYIFREIMSACLSLEEALNVVYLGPEGSFTQLATMKHFGHGINTRPINTIDEVFREVESGRAQYGIVPVENSTEGMVNYTLDNLIESSLKICGEVELEIHHCLMGSGASDGANKDTNNNASNNIKRIYSHQQSLAQCRKWLDANYPNVKRIAVSSNSKAARKARDTEGSAAIAGKNAAEIYGLTILEQNIEDRCNNTTRFIVMGRHPVSASGKDKTSFVVSMRDKPGALYELLAPFYQNGISLTRLETRPSKTDKWAYVFFIDIEGHLDQEPIKAVLQKLESKVIELRNLGSYPHAVLK